MAEVTGSSTYELFDIYSKDGSVKLSLIGYITNFQYFEDLHSPCVTAILDIANAGNIKDGKGFYNGLPIRKGERVHFKIKTPLDAALDREATLEYVLYVNDVKDIVMDKQFESFRLSLVSREQITNDQVRVARKYTGMTINKVVDQMIRILDPLAINEIEECESPCTVYGNMRKPFNVITSLCKKGVPVGAKSKSAGFFFWQTREGFNFRSIYGLIKSAVDNKKTIQKKKYVYSQIMESAAENPLINAYKILDIKANSTGDLSDSLSKGEDSIYRIYFNPLTYEFTQPNTSVFKNPKETRLGKAEKAPLVADPENIPNTMFASRVVFGVLDAGTATAGVSTALNWDPLNSEAQALSDYSRFFSQDYTLLIPCNTGLLAGEPIYIEIPDNTSEDPDIDIEQSGLYIIKEITHIFGSTKSYTGLRVVRDSLGITGQK
jgi:hypothetical protein